MAQISKIIVISSFRCLLYAPIIHFNKFSQKNIRIFHYFLTTIFIKKSFILLVYRNFLKMKPAIRDRDYMYRLVISQLFYDGYQQIAVSLSQAVNAYPSCPPSDKLFRLIMLGKQMDEDTKEKEGASFTGGEAPATGLDMEYDADVTPSTPEPALYETIFLTTHKAPCRAAAFNNDGTLIASGSVDASIKVMDVERIMAREHLPPEMEQTNAEVHPVIRTLYDHIEEVNCLAFHPREQILVSGSKDSTLKFFDFSKASVKRAFKTIFEVEPVRCLSFHPTGDYILVGTQHPTLRLYCVETSQCFVSSIPSDQHHAPITDVCYSDSARIYATSSKDGDVKIWDGVSNRVINTYQRAHDGAEVCSATFTRNSKYLLTSGKDSIVKLWELATNRCLVAYTGAGAAGQQELRAQARFNHNEDYVMLPDEKSGSLCSWDARNCDRKRLLALGHTAPVRYFVHSPTQPAFLTCSEDFRARFWYKKTTLE